LIVKEEKHKNKIMVMNEIWTCGVLFLFE